MAQSAEHRRAQRKLAADIRAGRRNILPKNLKGTAKQSNIAYARDVIAGREPMPALGTRESKMLARLGSLAKYGKAPAEFEAAFKSHWYHTKKKVDNIDEGGEVDRPADTDTGDSRDADS